MMQADVSAVVSRVRSLSQEQLIALPPDERTEIELFLSRARYSGEEKRCAERVASFETGPLYWLTNLTKTENPQFEKEGLPFRAPFPRKSYFVPLFHEFLARHDALFICKSRTMMTSWAALGFATWAAQWNQEETIVQTENEDKCIHLIDYVRQLWDNQEDWIKQRHPLARRTVFAISWADGGEVAAIPSGENKIRSFHPTTYILDEAAHVPEGEECLGAVRPSGARIICISTARDGWFGTQCSL
jgi:hypothetical protein